MKIENEKVISNIKIPSSAIPVGITEDRLYFIEGIKKQIPFAGAVLQGDLERKLKEQASAEAISALPEIEKMISLPISIVGGVIGILTSVFILNLGIG